MDVESEKKYLKEFEQLCEKYPLIIQEMAFEGDILDPNLIEICIKHGVKII